MDIKQSELPNKLRVITAHLPGFQSGAIGAFVNIGTRHETEQNNGVAHFLEHMAFKGTNKRTAYDISHQIEILGSHPNAMTSLGMTAYYANGLAKHAPVAADIIGDVLTDSLFDPEEIRLESGVILQEISQYEDDPFSTMNELLMETAYPNQPVGRKTLGTKEFVSNAKQDDFRNFISENYSAETMVLFAAGGIDHAAIVDAAMISFSKVPTTLNRKPAVPASYVGGLGIDTSKDFSQVSAGIMFPSVPVIDSALYAHALLSDAFGGGMSSPLFTEIREKRGLVYHTSSHHMAEEDFGNFAVVGGMTPDNLEEFIKVACAELAKLKSDISESDLERAKNARLVRLATMQENPARTIHYMADSLFNRGRIRTLDEIRKDIEAVTVADLVHAANRILAGKPTISLVGPVPDLDYEGMVKAELG